MGTKLHQMNLRHCTRGGERDRFLLLYLGLVVKVRLEVKGYALSHCKAPFLKTSCCVGFLGVRTGTTQRNHHSSRHLSRAKNSLDVVFLPHPGGIPHKLPQGGMGGIKIIRGVLAGNCEPKWPRFACLDLARPH